MKRVVLVLLVFTAAASTALAQVPDSSYVGLFADDARTTWAVYSPGATLPFTMYIYFLPGARGMQGAEFKILAPANVVISTKTKHPDITIEMGTLTGGISIAFGSCNPGGTWVRAYSISCFLLNTTVSQIEIVENPELLPPKLQIANCEPGYQKEPVKRFTHLYCNWDGGVATEGRSWGAIKSLF